MAEKFILKNTTGETLTYGGRTLPANDQNEYDGYHEQLIQRMFDQGLKADILAGDIIVNNFVTDLSPTRGWKYLSGYPATFYHHNGDQIQTFSTNNTTVLFDTTVEDAGDAFLYHPLSEGPIVGGSIDILVAGDYEIKYVLVVGNETNSSAESQAFITVNGTTLVGSSSFGYHRSKLVGNSTLSATVKTALSANDVVRVVVVSSSGGNLNTAANSCRLNIKSTGE